MGKLAVALTGSCVAATMLVGCGSGSITPKASPSRSFTETEAFRQFREVFPASVLTDAQVREAGGNICKRLDGGQTPQGIVDDGDTKSGGFPDQDTLRQFWAVIYVGVLVYCPKYQSQLPIARPY